MSSNGKIITSNNKVMRYFLSFIILTFFCIISPTYALEIGVIDLNEALNRSEPGIRSKNILERRGHQKQQEFKIEEEELV